MKHCKRFLSFLAAMALLLSLSLPSFSMAQDAPEVWAEDAESWDDEALWGDEDEAPAPEYGELQEDADPAPAADAAAEAPAADAPADETAEADTPDDGPEAAADAAADETAEADAPDDEPEAADEADADAPADAEEPSVSELLARPEEDPDEGGFELAPAPAFPEALDADEPEKPEGAASVGDGAETGDAAQAAPDPADGSEDWEDADFDGEAAPLEFPDLEDEADEAPAPEERAVLRFQAETHRGCADNVIVTVEADLDALPEDAVLRVEVVTDEQLLDAVVAEKQSLERRASLVRALRIAFCDAQGRPLQPGKPVRATLSFVEDGQAEELYLLRAEEAAEKADLSFAQVGTLQTEPEEQSPTEMELLDETRKDSAALEKGAALGPRNMFAQLRFELDAAGVYAILGMETVVFEHLSADGDRCTITISFDPERFAFLREAVLEVQPLEGEVLEACLEATAQALETVPEKLISARFFDIRLRAPDGTEYHELGGDVRVTVTLDEPLEMSESGALYAVHFPEGSDAPPELAEASLSEDGTELRFTQNGFSATGTVLTDYHLVDRWPNIWGFDYNVDEDWIPYVVLVKKPDTAQYYMLQLDTDSAAGTQFGRTKLTGYKVAALPVVVTPEDPNDPDSPLILNLPGDSFEDIDQCIWYDHKYKLSETSNNYYHTLKNAATGCLFGSASNKSTCDYCAGSQTGTKTGTNGTEIVDLKKDFDLRFFNRRLYSVVNDLKNTYYFFELTDDKYLRARFVTGPDTTSTFGPTTNALEFYFVSEIRINGQEIVRPSQIVYDPDASPYGAENPYSFHQYKDNPALDVPLKSITPDMPVAEKTLVSRNDGSYQLSLSVTANAGESIFPDRSAEVVLVVDVSPSMTDPHGNPSIDQEQKALKEIGEMLAAKDIPFHVILFSIGAWASDTTYTRENLTEFEALVDGLTAELNRNPVLGIPGFGKYTCWESALRLAGEVLQDIDAKETSDTDEQFKDKYVMFITDGYPNMYVEDDTLGEPEGWEISFSDDDGGSIAVVKGHGYMENAYNFVSGGEQEELRPLRIEQKLVAAGADVINVFINSDDQNESAPKLLKRMSNIAYAGALFTQEPPIGTYYEANAEEGNLAGELIAATRFMLRKYLYHDVSLHDGLTGGTALAGVYGLGPAGGQPDFSYTITQKDGTVYQGERTEDGTALHFFRETGAGIKYLTTAGSETDAQNAEDVLRLEPAAYNGEKREIDWNIQPADDASYTLIEDATYTVSFPVWPSQATYDAITGQENERENVTLTEGLSSLAGYDYSFPRSHAPSSCSGLFALLNISPADVKRVVSSDPDRISVEADGTQLVAQNLDAPVFLTIVSKDGSVIVVRVQGVQGQEGEPPVMPGPETWTYSFPFDHPPANLSSLFALLNISSPTEVVQAVSSDPDGMLLKREAPTWALTLSKGCRPALLTLTKRDGSVIAVYALDGPEAPLDPGLPSGREAIPYSFSFRQPPTSLAHLFDLLEEKGLLYEPNGQGIRTDIERIESSDPEHLAVTHTAPGKWGLQVAEDLNHGVMLAITRKDGVVIPVYVTDSKEALDSGTFSLKNYRYTFEKTAPPTTLSQLLAFPDLSSVEPESLASVVSADPDRISVTQNGEDWTLRVDPDLNHPVPLTITMNDGSVIVVFATPSDASESTLEKEPKTWGLSTNTSDTSVCYTPSLVSQEDKNPPELREFPPAKDGIENPDPVKPPVWIVYVRKLWLDGGVEHSKIKSLKLTLHQLSGDIDNPYFFDKVTLTAEDGWVSVDFTLSPGMMVTKTEETEGWGKAVTFNGKPYVLLNEGYGYYFTEEMEFTEETYASSYQYQLEKDVFYPVLVDGVPVNAHRVAVGDSYAYTDDGQLVRPLLAKNWMKGIYITKQVVDDKGNPVQPDGLTEQPGFTLRVTLTAPDGNVSLFPQLDGSEPDSPHIVRYYVLDQYGNIIQSESEAYLIFDDKGVAEGLITIGAGQMILFPKAPEGTRYQVVEENIPEGYALYGMACSAQDTGTGSFVPVEELADGGYLAGDSANRLVVRNKMGEFEPERKLPRIVIDKFQTGDRSQKLSGASFVLYRYPTEEELEEDPSLSAETPLYYSRGPDDEQPQFQPELALALTVTVTTDADGHAEFTDLPDGLYYLLETEAPVDYQKLVAPIAVTVDTSWLETAENPTQAQIEAALVFVVPIANLPKSTLPATGGYGAARWTGLGLLLLWGGAAGGLVLRGRRRRAPQ